ncbi:MAG: DUF5060 domain-containing protein [Deferribacteres bacterium]|nr:DUF5060 domain-containing protein [Deferribacteres bacterium]
MFPKYISLRTLRILCFALGFGFVTTVSGQVAEKSSTLWAPFVEWSFDNPTYSGNPFDLRATATFMHQASGTTHRTSLFYDGGTTWKLRFTGTRTGEWRFTTSSADAELDGLSGIVTIAPNNDSRIYGFLTAKNDKFALQTGENGELRGIILQVHWGAERLFKSGFTDLPTDVRDYGNAAYITNMVQYLLDRGCNSLAINVNNQWFKAGADSYEQHSSENPDLATFRAVETAIVTAHKLGARIHFWLWGDEERKWSAVGVGGINGTPDKRLQRYIAARLGPLPGWTMAYGFDLEEWVSDSQLREWASYLQGEMGWPHLLMARSFSNDALDVLSNDNRPTSGYYQDAVATVAAKPGRPHFYERRFLYTRDHWDMNNTMQAFWDFAMAGGIGCSWGLFYWNSTSPDYSNPEQLRTHARFWRDRLLLDLQRATNLSDGYVLKDQANSNFVFYKRDATSVLLKLSAMSGSQPIVAVDAKKEYAEIAVGDFSAQELTWNAPYRSDWVLAVGRFDQQQVEEPDDPTEIDHTAPVPPEGINVEQAPEAGKRSNDR